MAKNKIILTLEIEFSEDARVSNDDTLQIMGNVLTALESHINHGGGLAPEDPEHGDYITDKIKVIRADGVEMEKEIV